MKVTCTPAGGRIPSGAIKVVPFWQGEKTPAPACPKSRVPAAALAVIDERGFSAKEGELFPIAPTKKGESPLLLVGLGEAEGASVQQLRGAYAALARHRFFQRHRKSLNCIAPSVKGISEEDVVRGVMEGVMSLNYLHPHKREGAKESLPPIESLHIVGVGKGSQAWANRLVKTMEGVYFARDLVNGNADDVTPEHLAQQAKALAKRFPKLTAKVLNKAQLEKEKLNLLLTVGRAGMNDPRLIILHYKGNPKDKDLTLLVGKGVTYDTGGLNLKPTGFMETMRADMGGAGAVLGAMQALADLDAPVNVTAVIPSCENAIDSHSYKPGDVYTSYSGRTVEIGNTDAEGRLILADALAYGNKKFKPARIVDLATLTGACVVTFGTDCIGLMGNDERLADKMEEAGRQTFERVWSLPMFKEYRDLLKSDVADICNIGPRREAGTITAGKFLEEFVDGTPWLHLDIAGKAFLEGGGKPHLPKHATGVGVKLLVEFLTRQLDVK